MASRVFPAARANHNAHFHKRIPAPEVGNTDLNIKRQGNPFDVFTSLIGAGNDNPRHKHKTTTTPDPKPTVVIPPSPPTPAKPPVVAPSAPSVPVVISNPQSSVDSVVFISKATPTLSVIHSTTSSKVVHATSSASSSQDAKSANNSAGTAATNSSHSSSGVIVGVILAVVAVIALATGAWFIRKKRIAQRAKMRNSWKAGPGHGWAQDDSTLHTNLMAERTPDTPNFTKPLPDLARRASLAAQTTQLMLPPKTFNNPLGTVYSPTSTTDGTFENLRGQEEERALVKRGFIPSLPDELPVNIGDMIFVVTSYDDGWCLCRNGQGDQGMVPLECLNRSEAPKHGLGSQEVSRLDTRDDQRMSRRASSLYIGVASHNGY